MTWLVPALSALLGMVLLLLLVQQRKLRQEIQKQPADSALLLLQQQMENLRLQTGQHLEKSVELMQQQLGQLQLQMQERLHDSHELMQKSHQHVGSRLDHAAKVVGDLQGQLGRLQEANVRLFEVGKDLSSLQEILKTPKLRGSLGEYFLGDLLAQVLPEGSFGLQHSFQNREIVDAIVHLQKNSVSIDAKFPLENFRRLWACQEELEKKALRKIFISDVKKHVESIASKYIRPEEGTFDFALMYIPAENIYYELILRDSSIEDFSLIDYSMKKKVIPVSPNTLYIYLSTIVLGLKGMQIEKTAHDILNQLSRLHLELSKTQEAFRKVGLHLSNAKNSYDDAQVRLVKFQERFEKLQQQSEPSLNSINSPTEELNFESKSA